MKTLAQEASQQSDSRNAVKQLLREEASITTNTMKQLLLEVQAGFHGKEERLERELQEERAARANEEKEERAARQDLLLELKEEKAARAKQQVEQQETQNTVKKLTKLLEKADAEMKEAKAVRMHETEHHSLAEEELVREIKEEKASRAKDAEEQKALMAEIKQIKAGQATESSDKQELQAKVEAEETQLEHITHLLATLASSHVDANAGNLPKVLQKPAPEKDAFPLCRGQPLGQVQLAATTHSRSNKSHTSECSPDTHVRLFAPKVDNSAADPFEFGCCPVHEEYCAGCEVMDPTEGACKTCSGGFTLASGTCVACMDFPQWVDNSSRNCYEANCSDEAWVRSFAKCVPEPYQGISSREACCACGGGHREGTKPPGSAIGFSGGWSLSFGFFAGVGGGNGMKTVEPIRISSIVTSGLLEMERGEAQVRRQRKLLSPSFWYSEFMSRDFGLMLKASLVSMQRLVTDSCVLTRPRFVYYVAPMALGLTEVVGHPLPRTAHRYSLNKECELVKYGLSLEPETGKLKLAEGCGVLGCLESPIEVECIVTAHQGKGLSASTRLVVNVGAISYGPSPVVLLEGVSSVTPSLRSSIKADDAPFKLACAPEPSWLKIDETSGALSLVPESTASSLTDEKGMYLDRGATCMVSKGLSSTSVVVLAPVPWTSMSYAYAAGRPLYVTVGEKSPVLQVKGQGGPYATAPTRFSASCRHSDWHESVFAFDTITGLATFEGHRIFSLDVATGESAPGDRSMAVNEHRIHFAAQYISELSLDLNLEHTFARSQQKAKKMTCNIYGHYEWTLSGQRAVLAHSIQNLSIRDHTCWAIRKVGFAKYKKIRAVGKGPRGMVACMNHCRRDPSCTHIGIFTFKSGTRWCIRADGICSDSKDDACRYKDRVVRERYTGCGERHSCLAVFIANFNYLSGKYCFQGENAAGESQGPVYFKRGQTPQARAMATDRMRSRTETVSL
ncbi:unnamed protein product [Symbiodinium sp. CCMP2592]|nr:unnamed protein product [Symbiodinium sp. CCMP2592]